MWNLSAWKRRGGSFTSCLHLQLPGTPVQLSVTRGHGAGLTHTCSPLSFPSLPTFLSFITAQPSNSCIKRPQNNRDRIKQLILCVHTLPMKVKQIRSMTAGQCFMHSLRSCLLSLLCFNGFLNGCFIFCVAVWALLC